MPAHTNQAEIIIRRRSARRWRSRGFPDTAQRLEYPVVTQRR